MAIVPKANLENRWGSLPLEDLYHEFGTHPESGLSDSKAEHIRTRTGENELKKKREKNIFDYFLHELGNPLSLILLLAGLATLFLSSFRDTVVIFIAVAINIVIGTVEEYQADRAFLALQKLETKEAIVVRDGHRKLLPAKELVPGDVVVLESGASVPADIRLIEAGDLLVNESVLSGEWEPVQKNSLVALKGTANMLFMGTFVVAGHGRGVVVRIGEDTMLGEIADSLKTEPEKTPFEKSIDKLGQFILLIVLFFLIVIIVLSLERGTPLAEILLVAIALAVSAIPEGLPIAVSVTLAFGMKQILATGGLVRNLLAAETLGSTTVILTDKTGTLTEGEMRVQAVVTPSEVFHREKEDHTRILSYAVLNSEAFVEKKDLSGNPIVHGRPVERALVLAGLAEEIEEEFLKSHYRRLESIRFDSRRRFSASIVAHEDDRRKRLIIVGAPEDVISASASFVHKGRSETLSHAGKEHLRKFQEEKSSEGKRLVAVAYRETTHEIFPKDENELRSYVFRDLVFGGVIVLEDPLRSTARESVRRVESAGVRVIMVTGDFPATARGIARDAGISGAGEAVTGEEIALLSDEALLETLKKYSVFARILPHQKLRIATILRNAGEVIAMTGDGINDAPALRHADIGVALGSGTEVAKEASDLVLLKNDFGVIVSAIEEGRRIIDNLKKIVVYLLSTSFIELLLVIAALALALPLPILPAQILWANIVGEGFMNFAFVFEPKEGDLLRRNPRNREMREILSREVITLIAAITLVTSGLLFTFFYILSQGSLPVSKLQTIVFASISFSGIFFALSLRNFKVPIWKMDHFSNRALVFSVTLSFLALLYALFFPPLRNLLDLEPLAWKEILWVVYFALINLVLVEIVKFFVFFRRAKIVE